MRERDLIDNGAHRRNIRERHRQIVYFRLSIRVTLVAIALALFDQLIPLLTTFVKFLNPCLLQYIYGITIPNYLALAHYNGSWKIISFIERIEQLFRNIPILMVLTPFNLISLLIIWRHFKRVYFSYRHKHVYRPLSSDLVTPLIHQAKSETRFV